MDPTSGADHLWGHLLRGKYLHCSRTTALPGLVSFFLLLHLLYHRRSQPLAWQLWCPALPLCFGSWLQLIYYLSKFRNSTFPTVANLITFMTIFSPAGRQRHIYLIPDKLHEMVPDTYAKPCEIYVNATSDSATGESKYYWPCYRPSPQCMAVANWSYWPLASINTQQWVD